MPARAKNSKKTENGDFFHMVSQGLREISMGQKTYRRMIPKPESHQSKAFFRLFRLKNQKRLRNRSNLVEIQVWPSQNTYFLTPEKMVMTIWPNSLNLRFKIKDVPRNFGVFSDFPPFGALYIITRFGGRRHGRRLTNPISWAYTMDVVGGEGTEGTEVTEGIEESFLSDVMKNTINSNTPKNQHTTFWRV